ncbi:hypothetical protein IFM89_012162 [Coptis chinensis]|uniref:Pentatricopeptide repeat-containing protein n=1 Tax=Coptis chinensis TaxID=261450 RepID=A0A835HDP6_9MAGN|nr:hypothetical protein IFM89_012162 [Coptis chinensis]
MISKSHLPNVITYSTLVHGLCKEGNLQGVVEVLDRMKLQDLKPDAGLYGKLVTGLCELSKFQDAANFLDEMVLGGISPNHVYLSTRTRGISVSAKSFSSLVACFCKKGDVHKAFRIVSEMVLDGCVPDEDTWNAAVGGFWCRKKARDAADLLQTELMGEFATSKCSN